MEDHDEPITINPISIDVVDVDAETSFYDSSIQGVTKVKRSKRTYWKTYAARPSIKLFTAVALSLDWKTPSKISYLGQTEKSKSRLRSRMATALSALQTNNSYIKIYKQGTRFDGADWLIDTASFVTFSQLPTTNWKNLTEEFKALGTPVLSVSSGPSPQASKKVKASIQFCNLITKLLVEIAYCAGKKNLDFDLENVPGTKKGFQKFAAKCNSVFGSYKKLTFDDYIESFCKFGPGSKESDFFDNLFDGKPPQIK